MNPRNRRGLRSEMRFWIPAGIKQYKDGLDAMTRGYLEEGIHAACESLGVLLPEQIVQKHPHGVHAELLRPSQLQVDPLRIEGVRLPHLQLIDGVRRNVIASQRPGLFGIPFVCLGCRPSLQVGGVSGVTEQHPCSNQEKPSDVLHTDYGRLIEPPSTAVCGGCQVLASSASMAAMRRGVTKTVLACV